MGSFISKLFDAIVSGVILFYLVIAVFLGMVIAPIRGISFLVGGIIGNWYYWTEYYVIGTQYRVELEPYIQTVEYQGYPPDLMENIITYLINWAFPMWGCAGIIAFVLLIAGKYDAVVDSWIRVEEKRLEK